MPWRLEQGLGTGIQLEGVDVEIAFGSPDLIDFETFAAFLDRN
eukprot:CAMPEP_0172643306 /NCGR_PEP_ID=MMETSP1068-20121228/236374_1 /TAXON_ID=35684 /ORGANISM="Pseudopedinella elastica, Strain CCMP716" /LENGTH=42 /DNA_ID= /DNA_START= /DNA_END= /DNA_ORIENTATION=